MRAYLHQLRLVRSKGRLRPPSLSAGSWDGTAAVRERGFDGVTIAEIAAAADVSEKTVSTTSRRRSVRRPRGGAR
jgi:hypothetical protein